MKRLWLVPALAVALAVVPGYAQTGSYPVADKQPTTRLLQGQVTDNDEKPLPNAVVYLKNTKTMAVKTFIAEKDGTYRFPALSPNIDYEVYAEHNGRKSDTKTLSSFDSRKTAYINLKIK